MHISLTDAQALAVEQALDARQRQIIEQAGRLWFLRVGDIDQQAPDNGADMFFESGPIDPYAARIDEAREAYLATREVFEILKGRPPDRAVLARYFAIDAEAAAYEFGRRHDGAMTPAQARLVAQDRGGP